MPNATVMEIDLNATHANGKQYVKFTTQAPAHPKYGEKPPRTHMLWAPHANALIEIVKTLKVGDQCSYDVDMDSQYKNMTALRKVEGGAPAAGPGAPAKAPFKRDDNVTKSIARAASMKEATQILMHNNPKKLIAAQQVMELTKDLEKFLLFEDVVTVEPNEMGMQEAPGFQETPPFE